LLNDDFIDDKITTPWQAHEAVFVNGIKCCYKAVKRQGYLVYLPGGGAKYAHDLIFEGYTVILPYKVRE
jgi:hypothetical protein|tara:strand:- start:11327 stop:11533 length:207 start_codon:yes stop_codon:yes gene_type:complete